MKDCIILDCTLRDGGYYNNWDFSLEESRKILTALNLSGVSIVETGYRSSESSDYYGLFRYCPENLIRDILPDKNILELSFMLDAREFLCKEGLSELDNLVKPTEDSLYKWCRIAAYGNEITSCGPLIDHLNNKGYKTILNLMGISLLPENELEEILDAISVFSISAFYFADSFGSLHPEDVAALVTRIRRKITAPLGFHAHANQGLEYINALTALDNGVTFIDTTLMGMGRGAGNLKTEQMVLGLFGQGEASRFNPYPLLDALEYVMKPLNQKYRWGWDFEYMLSGIKNIHPTYCQELKSSHLFTIKQASDILNRIPEDKRLKYSNKELLQAIEETINLNNIEFEECSYPIFNSFDTADNILILARGPQAGINKKALGLWIDKWKPLILECNDTGYLKGRNRLTVILNKVRFREALEMETTENQTIIYGGTGRVNHTASIFHYPVEIVKQADSAAKQEKSAIPFYNVTAYALDLASRFHPKNLFIAGFDGDQTDSEASLNEKRITQAIFDDYLPKILPDVSFFSLTRTDYRIPVRSVYSLL